MSFRFRQLALATLMLPLMACSASAAEESTDAVKAAFKGKFPQHEVTSVQAAPVAGLYEVVVKMKRGNREDFTIVYVDGKVEHLITGDLIDTQSRRSLTEARDSARNLARESRDTAHALALTVESQRAQIVALSQALERMGGQRGQLDSRLGDLAAQLADGDAPVKALEDERQLALGERVRTEKELAGARSALEGIDNELRQFEQVRQQRDAQHRCIHLQGIDHGSQAHQGLQFGIYIDALHLQEGILAIGPRHGHVMQAQFQRPGPEAHSPDRHPAPQHLRGQPLPLATKEWRDREPAQHPEQHERGQGPRQPSGPGSVLERSQESWKIHCQWRRDAWVFTTRHWTRVHGCPRNRMKQESPEERRHAPPIRA